MEEITIELLLREREAFLRWHGTPEVRSQLKSFESSDDIETITVDGLDGDDTFDVTPAAGITFNIRGNNPSASDSLTFNGQGAASETLVQASGLWSWIRPLLVRGLRAIPLGRHAFRIAAREGSPKGSDEAVPGVVLLLGAESTLRDAALTELRERALGDAPREFNGPYTGRYLDPDYVYRDAAATMGQGDAARRLAERTSEKLT